jgi:2-haloacid dehalogenase
LARYGGLPWDTVLGAEIARAYKPQPAVYLASASALGLVPAEVMMVAAHNGDLAAARAAGLKTAFVPRPSEYGPGQTSDLNPDSDWDAMASDLNDLARKLGP